ncbi:hypothetical protein G6K88_22010 [Agrobacterium rhizogenes]|uniref:hypothetical protein n=1 Tax=Rhizobium rhizogenes TaxID=359 RepID=UPI001572358E|nr:hypothetical protein [Rhizobium rhizogenes]NTH66580.1 hypothetical protein [Rhizobium rhizogenes]NTI04702.1 hypothetical protein [Rhizobium rhizogenes]NTI11511.1 hypothetical protein [Rhizobium rhizogenes]
MTYTVKVEGQDALRIQFDWKNPNKIPDLPRSWSTADGRKAEVVIVAPNGSKTEDMRTPAQKEKYNLRVVPDGPSKSPPKVEAKAGGAAKRPEGQSPRPGQSDSGNPAKKASPEANDKVKKTGQGDTDTKRSAGGAPSLRQMTSPEQGGKKQEKKASQSDGSKANRDGTATQQPRKPLEGGDKKQTTGDPSGKSGDQGSTQGQTGQGQAAGESGAHLPGGKGEISKGSQRQAAEGGHGHDKTEAPAKTDLDYAMLFNEMLDPMFIARVMSLFGKGGDTVMSGGVPEGIGPKENASEIGQAGIAGANILFAMFDTVLAGGRKALQQFRNKKEMFGAFKKEIKAGRMMSQGIHEIVPGGALTEQEAAGAAAFRDAILNGKEFGPAGTIAHDKAGANAVPLAEANRYGLSNSPVIKPGPDFIRHGGAAAQEIKFHAGYISPQQLEHATAQTMADNVVYQQGTGLVKLRLPTIHIYVDLRTGQAAKWLQRF